MYQDEIINSKARVSVMPGMKRVTAVKKKYDIGKELGQGAYGLVSECSLKGTSGGEVFAMKSMKKNNKEI